MLLFKDNFVLPIGIWRLNHCMLQYEKVELYISQRSPQRAREREEPEVVVPYLSPVVLRKELETIISQDGGDILSREELATSR